jgi:hypothetical protein
MSSVCVHDRSFLSPSIAVDVAARRVELGDHVGELDAERDVWPKNEWKPTPNLAPIFVPFTAQT